MQADSISVIIPAHNGAGFYSSALDSILLQRWPSLEIILIDDGSTDNLFEYVSKRGVPVQYVRQDRQGPSAARNRGIRETSSELIAFLDIDDCWTSGHLARLRQALQDDPGAGFAQGLIQQFTLRPDGGCLTSGAYRMPYLGSCLFHRHVFERCGTFDEAIQMGEDYDFIFRCWENDIPRQCVDKVSLLYRRHSGNMTRGMNRKANLQVLQRRMQRIRSGALDLNARRRYSFATYIGDIRNFADTPLETAEQWNALSAS